MMPTGTTAQWGKEGEKEAARLSFLFSCDALVLLADFISFFLWGVEGGRHCRHPWAGRPDRMDSLVLSDHPWTSSCSSSRGSWILMLTRPG